MSPLRIFLAACVLSTAACATTRSEAPAAATAAPGAFQPTSFQVAVKGHGAPMVLIPGFASAGAVWDELVGRYQDRYTCYVITVAGFAGTKPSGADAVMPRVREELAQFITANHLEQPVVVGHSMGGVIALQLAAAHPELVGKLVIVDSLPYLPAAQNPKATPASVERYAGEMKLRLAQQQLDERRAYERMALPSMITDPAKVDVALDWVMHSDGDTMGQAFYEMMTTDLRPELAKIQAPALVMLTWVGYGAGATREMVEELGKGQYATLKQAKLEVADRAKHFIMWDDPQWLYAQMDAFLATAAAPSAQR